MALQTTNNSNNNKSPPMRAGESVVIVKRLAYMRAFFIINFKPNFIMQITKSKKSYDHLKDHLETEKAIEKVKKTFSNFLSGHLKLQKVVSPIIVSEASGINDELSGTERPVSFLLKNIHGIKGVIVQSLAKWKRLRLAQLSVPSGEGIFADMHALRPDETPGPLHSVYVDQWDWEQVIDSSQYRLDCLKDTVVKIYAALLQTEQIINFYYPSIDRILPSEITFIHAEDLLRTYPDLSPSEREHKAAKKYGAIFLIGIGKQLSNGEPHDGRAPDYDDWSTETSAGYFGLNGDIIVWNPVLKCAFELSSMGIRVNKKALIKQLMLSESMEKAEQYYHKALLEGKLPQTIGGGIGQSRLCMFLLRKKHIGEVQASVWPDDVYSHCKTEGINIIE